MTPQALAEGVCMSLASGTANASTVTTLQSLLNSEFGTSAERPQTATEDAAAGRKSASRTAKASVRTKKAQTIRVHEDERRTLSPSERYALATEVVNCALKALSEALKPQQHRVHRRISTAQNVAPSPSSPRGLSQAPSISERALQPTSGNATSTQSSPMKRTQLSRTSSVSSSLSTVRTSESILATAECARLGFAYLRSVNTKNLGVREPPKLQLETGMLALVSKLLAHGLESLAVRELRITKRRLEGLHDCDTKARPSKATPKTSAAVAEKATLANLLQLRVDFDAIPEASTLGITHQLHVLKVIARSRKPATVEAAIEYLSLENANTPANLIPLQAHRSGEKPKAIRQLEVLSQTLLSLCPGLSSTLDAAPQEIRPEAALKLQTLALIVRKRRCDLAGHSAEYDRELLEPYSKCLSTFSRRFHTTLTAADACEIAEQCTEDLLSNIAKAPGSVRFTIHKTLCLLAESAARNEAALRWVRLMLEDSLTLEPNHARRLAVVVKQARLHITSGEMFEDLQTVKDALTVPLTGQLADYDFLHNELAGLTRRLALEMQNDDVLDLRKHVIILSAGFAQRYVRSYPGKGLQQAQTILYQALHLSRRPEDVLEWMSGDAVDVFSASSCLQTVAEVAASKPFRDAWHATTSTFALSRIIRALAVKAMRSGGEHCVSSLYDNGKLQPAQRGAILQLQLSHILEYVSRPKYSTSLGRLLPELLRRLGRVYTPEQYPLRRARIATLALRLRESCPDLLQPHALKVWQATALPDRQQLGDDKALCPYYEDLKASLETTRLFCNGRPATEDLKGALLAWEGILNSSPDESTLRQHMDDPASVATQLSSIAVYSAMLGEPTAHLATLRLLVRLHQLLGGHEAEQLDALVRLSMQYLDLCYSEEAGVVLAPAQKLASMTEIAGLAKLRFHLAYARYQLRADNMSGCKTSLENASKVRFDLQPERVPKHERPAYEQVHAEGWLLQSKYLLASGSPHQALASAKRAVKLYNGVWKRTERASGTHNMNTDSDLAEPTDTEMGNLVAGVSKLKLSPKASASNPDSFETNKKGAAFWPLVPSICDALVHASEIYAHHGIFQDANFYSERAVKIAESVASPALLIRTRTHRARLLTLAGRLEDAELCLATHEPGEAPAQTLASVDWHRAKAAIRVKEGCLEEAMGLYEKAKSLVTGLCSPKIVNNIDRFDGEADALGSQPSEKPIALLPETTLVSNSDTRQVSKRAPAARGQASKPPSSNKKGRMTANRPNKSQHAQTRRGDEEACKPAPYLLTKIKADITLEMALVLLRLGNDIGSVTAELQSMKCPVSDALKQRRLQFEDVMQKAAKALQSDFTYNSLLETSIAYPTLLRAERRISDSAAPRLSLSLSLQKTGTIIAPAVKAVSRKVAAKQTFDALLMEAEDNILHCSPHAARYSQTAEVHLCGGMMSSVLMLLSAAGNAQAKTALHPIRSGFALELGRVYALQGELEAASVDARSPDRVEPLDWPCLKEDAAVTAVAAKTFQDDFINILPKSWTAVSLCLSEDCSELLVARYRRDQAPFIIRLPFSRHKPEGVDEDIFDFDAGKAELQDIIQLSNYSCHNGGDVSSKGAKSNWWSAREGLDKRLHELLINIEGIWLGGFKGILSPKPRRQDLLSSFRKSFEGILDRHLPSRQASKSRTKQLVLDHNILELFVDLESDVDGSLDLDEPIADLLYLVVDMLQFNGERNAYDEIDFDCMTIEVLEALRAYDEATAYRKQSDQHLILVLDKRLQCFPWESLPYLDGVSVSRVGSMLSLRERILAMRQSHQESGLDSDAHYHHVSRKTGGTYVLDPSSDLPSTQTTLHPALSRLSEAQGMSWKSFVNRAPTEQDLIEGLSHSSMLLYFGHGAGTQYIRPRRIKKLERCSEVVWLMGCSSGAVTEYGELEPQAVPLTYLLAGSKSATSPGSTEGGGSSDPDGLEVDSDRCMAVLATLWDVTDKDIDRFSLAVGEDWGLWRASAEPTKMPGKTTGKRDRLATPSTPQRIPKIPKTPNIRKTPGISRRPAQRRGGAGGGGEESRQKVSLNEAVARCRDACYLRYLNGAAPVVYGVPVYLGD